MCQICLFKFKRDISSKSGIYLNCAVLGSLLVPLKPQRRKKLQEGVKLLVDDVVTQSVPHHTFNEVERVDQNEVTVQEQLVKKTVHSGKLEQQVETLLIILRDNYSLHLIKVR